MGGPKGSEFAFQCRMKNQLPRIELRNGDSGEAERWFRRKKPNGIPGCSKTPSVSVATLATRLCGKVFGFVKRNLSGAERRKATAGGERRAGKGAAALVPASARRDREREKRSESPAH
jgi:hypothetical protein